jgi:hypothetical protein
VNASGDSMTGDLNMTNHSIWNVDILQVHNITGGSPVYISSNVIVGLGLYYYGSGKYLTDINSSPLILTIEKYINILIFLYFMGNITAKSL